MDESPVRRVRRRLLKISAAGGLLGAGMWTLPAAAPVAVLAGHHTRALVRATFTAPSQLPQSGGLGEPSLAADNGAGNNGVQRLYITAPQSLGTITTGGSPLFSSSDGGTSWSGPVRSLMCTGLSGGDTDLTTDAGGNVYQTDLWLGNSCLSVSEDHGASFTAGNPFGSQLQPGDDRPWLAYDARSNQNYIAYDGVDALHVASTGPLLNAAVGLQAIQDTPVVPESLINTGSAPSSVRECVCPPGGIAADNSSGPHAGRVYVAYSHQDGVAVSYGDLSGACPACTVASWSQPVVIPGSGGSGSAFEDEWNFNPVKVDGNGTVYAMWGHALKFDPSNDVAAGGVQEEYAFSKDGGNTWSGPFALSGGGTTTFPTMDVVSPGVIDVAWYGTSASGDPNSVPSNATWNVDYARVTGADTSSPVVTAQVAASNIHTGCIQSGGGASCSDRSLLDFFQLVDANGVANIVYTAGDATRGTNVWFTKA